MTTNKRLNIIDEARGFTLISMILYHFCWDLKYIAGFSLEWYTGPLGYVWQRSICMSFIIISGFCFCMGKNRLKRSATVFAAGLIITAVTLIAMPENRIVFGVLTFLGTAGLIMIPVDKIHRILERKLDTRTINLTMIIGSILLFVVFYDVNYGMLFVGHKMELPAYLYSGYFETFLGFPDPMFYSTDYFSILPWIFLYMAGYYIYRLVMCVKASEAVCDALSRNRFKSIAFIGRKSLIIYMLHQPVLYAITLLIMKHLGETHGL